MNQRHILFIEPFYGGSHRHVADELVRRSGHTIELLTLPDRFWKWRRRYAAFELARRAHHAAYDLIVVSDYVDIGDLKALAAEAAAAAAPPGRVPPIYWYCHETQGTYPLPTGQTVAADVVAADVRNALHAERIAFNSAFHRDAFLDVYARHLAELQQWEPEITLPSAEQICAKITVVHPGIRPVGLARVPSRSASPLILWNHRWEYDKNFALFARVMRRLVDQGVSFRVAILGENPQAEPKEFLQAQSDLADRLVTFGYAPTRGEYHRWLQTADIVISTAIQENFGIAVLEAMSAGCIPLLPHRLAYPEILPVELHHACLFVGDRGLEQKLRRMLGALAGSQPRPAVPTPEQVAAAAARFSWDRQIEHFDRWLGSTEHAGRS